MKAYQLRHIQKDDPLSLNHSRDPRNKFENCSTVSKENPLQWASIINDTNNISPVNKRKLDSFGNSNEGTPVKLAKIEYLSTISSCQSHTISREGVDSHHSKGIVARGTNVFGSDCNESKNGDLLLNQLIHIFPQMDLNLLIQYCDIGLNLYQVVDIILLNNKSTKSTSNLTLRNCNNSKQINTTNLGSDIEPSNESRATVSENNWVRSSLEENNYGSGSYPSTFSAMTFSSTSSSAATHSSTYDAVGIKSLTFENKIKTTNLDKLTEGVFIEPLNKNVKFVIAKVTELSNDPEAEVSSAITQSKYKDYQGKYQLEFLLQIFPDGDPKFLKEKSKLDVGELVFFISETIDNNNYPKLVTRFVQKEKLEDKNELGRNLLFLQEACFVEHKEEIKAYIDKIAEDKRIAYEQAKERIDPRPTLIDLIHCGCCYDELIFEEFAPCNDGDLFCKECVRKGTEIRIGEGHTSFPCLANCGAEFSLQVLQTLLDARVFSRLLQRIKMAEVRATEIEGLEVCPFCDFASVPPPETGLFVCLNPGCLKESCRKCHKISHVPFSCDQLKTDDQAHGRKFVGDKMIKSLDRECYKCHKAFIKEDGCNKMTCTCGASMCYICRQPITDYNHFYNFDVSNTTDIDDRYFDDELPNQPNRDNRCALYSTIDSLHEDAVKKKAESVFQEVTEKNPGLTLKHGPSLILA